MTAGRHHGKKKVNVWKKERKEIGTETHWVFRAVEARPRTINVIIILFKKRNDDGVGLHWTGRRHPAIISVTVYAAKRKRNLLNFCRRTRGTNSWSLRLENWNGSSSLFVYFSFEMNRWFEIMLLYCWSVGSFLKKKKYPPKFVSEIDGPSTISRLIKTWKPIEN